MNTTQPTLETERLILRPFTPGDADIVAALAGDRRVAEMTQNIPHPYPPEAAVEWIRSHPSRYDNNEEAVFAIERKAEKDLIGAVGLVHTIRDRKGELGYWVGVPYWNSGYCTEAARAVVAFGFSTWGMHRIQARHYTKNPASGRVMEKIGMTYEGCLRQCVQKWGEYLDVCIYGILEEEEIL